MTSPYQEDAVLSTHTTYPEIQIAQWSHEALVAESPDTQYFQKHAYSHYQGRKTRERVVSLKSRCPEFQFDLAQNWCLEALDVGSDNLWKKKIKAMHILAKLAGWFKQKLSVASIL